jgi:hypothetical protein
VISLVAKTFNHLRVALSFAFEKDEELKANETVCVFSAAAEFLGNSNESGKWKTTGNLEYV